MRDVTETMTFTTEDIRRENIKMILKEVSNALEERGYNSENQIAGYLISNDPAYISSHKNARNLIQRIERYEIIEELVRAYLEKEWDVLLDWISEVKLVGLQSVTRQDFLPEL